MWKQQKKGAVACVTRKTKLGYLDQVSTAEDIKVKQTDKKQLTLIKLEGGKDNATTM